MILLYKKKKNLKHIFQKQDKAPLKTATFTCFDLQKIKI